MTPSTGRAGATRVDAAVWTDSPTAAHTGDSTRWFAPASAVAVVVIGRALQIRDGVLHPDAVFWLTVALVLLVGASVANRPIRFAVWDEKAVRAIALGGLVVHALQLYAASPGLDL